MEQLKVTKGPLGTGPKVCSARATSSLPVPDSPWINTDALYGPNRCTVFNTRRMFAERTTIPPISSGEGDA